MIPIHYSKKNTPYMKASDLHRMLGIKTPLRKWFPRAIGTQFVDGKDYSILSKTVSRPQGGSMTKIDWGMQIYVAKDIAIRQDTPNGRKLRDFLIKLEEEISEGLYINVKQMRALRDICEVCGFFSVQKQLERDHHAIFNSKTENWWDYRARLLGYSAAILKDKMKALNRQYVNQRHALMYVDRYKLIEDAIKDLFILLGKSEPYARNVSAFAKEIAEMSDPPIYNDIGATIDFKTPEQKATIKVIQTRDRDHELLEGF